MGWAPQHRSRDRRADWPRFGLGNFALWLPVGFLLFVEIGALLHHLPWAVPGAYAVVSLLSAATYAHDKSKAQSDSWRTPEATLHLLDLFGGWPGGMLAQRIVRHKIRKTGFQIIFWICILIHLVFWSWVFVNVPAEKDFSAFVGKVYVSFANTVRLSR